MRMSQNETGLTALTMLNLRDFVGGAVPKLGWSILSISQGWTPFCMLSPNWSMHSGMPILSRIISKISYSNVDCIKQRFKRSVKRPYALTSIGVLQIPIAQTWPFADCYSCSLAK